MLNKVFNPYITKNIISQVLEVLVQLHSLNIIHTGVDNCAWNFTAICKMVDIFENFSCAPLFV
jgi:hypothetical protein